MIPTAEQQHIIHRCKAMIKRAFPEMTGKIIFKLDSSKLGIEKGISVDMFLPDLKTHAQENSQAVNLVDLHQ